MPLLLHNNNDEGHYNKKAPNDYQEGHNDYNKKGHNDYNKKGHNNQEGHNNKGGDWDHNNGVRRETLRSANEFE
jgi:hypothetical protein